jgi:hypothetical protein
LSIAGGEGVEWDCDTHSHSLSSTATNFGVYDGATLDENIFKTFSGDCGYKLKFLNESKFSSVQEALTLPTYTALISKMGDFLACAFCLISFFFLAS